MTDLFGNTDLFGQASLFGDTPDRMPHQPQADTTPDPERVREKLQSLLATAKAAETLPWPERKARVWRIVFPQMANWLPEEEAEQLRFEFAKELERLKLAA
ncbi:MAG: hypothetical protein ACO1OX_04580 [Novosphingobium sp.]